MTVAEDFLVRMAGEKKRELEDLKREVPLSLLKRSVREAPPARSIDLPEPFTGTGVIAEVKRASPSAGDIRPDLDPVELAGEYAAGGAAGISVLTEPNYFKGSVEDLLLVRSAVPVLVLRKDFIIDPYDVYRSRGLGADMVLLIAAMLERDRMERLLDLTLELSMTPLIELHDDNDLETVKGLECPLIGINNRDLKGLTVSLETSFRLAPRVLDAFPGYRLVSESGIDGPETVARLSEAGFSAVLVGEYLVRSRDRRKAVSDLIVGQGARSAESTVKA